MIFFFLLEDSTLCNEAAWPHEKHCRMSQVHFASSFPTVENQRRQCVPVFFICSNKIVKVNKLFFFFFSFLFLFLLLIFFSAAAARVFLSPSVNFLLYQRKTFQLLNAWLARDNLVLNSILKESYGPSGLCHDKSSNAVRPARQHSTSTAHRKNCLASNVLAVLMQCSRHHSSTCVETLLLKC